MPFTNNGDVKVCACKEHADKDDFDCMRGKEPIPYIECRRYLREKVNIAARIRSLDEHPRNLKWTIGKVPFPFVDES